MVAQSEIYECQWIGIDGELNRVLVLTEYFGLFEVRSKRHA